MKAYYMYFSKNIGFICDPRCIMGLFKGGKSKNKGFKQKNLSFYPEFLKDHPFFDDKNNI